MSLACSDFSRSGLSYFSPADARALCSSVILRDGAWRSRPSRERERLLLQLQRDPEWADVGLSQVRRAHSAAPKADADMVAARRKEKKMEHEAERDRAKRARPAEELAQQQRQQQREQKEADELAARRANAVRECRGPGWHTLGPRYDARPRTCACTRRGACDLQ